MKKDYCHVTLILDRSGSMATIRNDVVGGVNQFLKQQRETPGECTLTLVQFDTSNPYEVLCDGRPIKDAADLGDNYQPRGGTPLYDAIGMGIVKTGEWLAAKPESERPEKVVFVTMTDGEENSSREYSKNLVAKMTKEQTEKYKWEFVYLGADHDAMKAGHDLGIPAAYASPYNKSNFAGAMKVTSDKLREVRTSGGNMALDASDRKAMS